MKPTRLFVCTILLFSVASCKVLKYGTENGRQYVDLGLSVNWAVRNVGADAPQDTGYYFAWGETDPKFTYRWKNYKFRVEGSTDKDVSLCKYITNAEYGNLDGLTTLEPSDDVACDIWGGRWRMPTSSEFDELIANCTWTWTTVKGVPGYKIKGKKKGFRRRSIFLPAVGRSTLPDEDVSFSDAYWSSTLLNNQYGCVTFLLPTDYTFGGVVRYVGLPVRPVCPK